MCGDPHSFVNTDVIGVCSRNVMQLLRMIVQNFLMLFSKANICINITRNWKMFLNNLLDFLLFVLC